MAFRDSGSRPSGGRGSCRAVGRVVVRLGRSLALPESCKAIWPRGVQSPSEFLHDGAGRSQPIHSAKDWYASWDSCPQFIRAEADEEPLLREHEFRDHPALLA